MIAGWTVAGKKKCPSGGTVFRDCDGFRRAWMGENAEKGIAAFFACAAFGWRRVRQAAAVFFRSGMISHGTWPLPEWPGYTRASGFFLSGFARQVSMKAVTMAVESVMQIYRQSVFAAVAMPGTSRGLPESFGPDPSRARVRCWKPVAGNGAVRKRGCGRIRAAGGAREEVSLPKGCADSAPGVNGGKP